MVRKQSPSRQLAKYRAKRDFTKTAEPSGVRAANGGGFSYLIQKHAARRLHYDFRLELNGTLKSWAVTKGPSLDPANKRLAVHVEDHPLDYGRFEGTIPHGQYGGGTVMLWDQGTWEPVGDAERSYAKGNLTFELHGKRLKGRWHLVRMRARSARDEKHDNWLLIKGKDEYANAANGDEALEKYQTSVVSRRGMEGIAKTDKTWRSNRAEKTGSAPRKKKDRKPLRKNGKNFASPPDFVPPELATLVQAPPQGENWVHEIKFDGYRLLARIDKGRVRLVTRANNDWTHKFKSIATALLELGVDNVLLDGEAVSVAPDGTMSFHGLQNALSTGDSKSLQYYVFDLLFLDGVDWRDRPLLERKEKLKAILENAPSSIHYSDHFDEPGTKVLQHACHIALEGIISKRAEAAYHSGRTDHWLKSKCTHEQEVVIGGYTTQPKHPGALGAMLTGYYEKGELVFSGKAGTGFSHLEGRQMVKRLEKLERKTPPFKSVPVDARHGARWVEPKLVAQIHFTEWTPDGRMRHPSYQGLREDKPAEDVAREKAKEMPVKKTSKTSVKPAKGKTGIAGVVLSHPDKKLYPEENITKLDLAHYYEKIAPLMLPHVAGRPISLVRCPEGEGKPCFFQRHGPETLPPYVKPVRVEGKGGGAPYLMIEDVRGLISLVQMGVLEIHIWGSHADDPKKPDRIVFDLDPAPDVPFAEVKKSAAELRRHLEAIKLKSFLKTTGGKGLHVVVPFQKGPTWTEAKAFSRRLAALMTQAAPDRFTINNRKDVRKGKIFIDYLRNSEGASAIAPYSTRAREGAPLALPLDWKDLPKLKSAHEVTVKTIGKRLTKDPWKDIAKVKQKLPLTALGKA